MKFQLIITYLRVINMMIDWVKKNMTTDLKCFHNYNSNDKKNTTKSHVNAKIKRYVCLL